jgi:hypothetical protein
VAPQPAPQLVLLFFYTPSPPPFHLYKHRGPGFDSRALLRIFLRELGLERGQLSLVIG